MKNKINKVITHIDRYLAKLFHKSIKLPKSVNDLIVTLIPFIIFMEIIISFFMILISLFNVDYLNMILFFLTFLLSIRLASPILKQKLIGLGFLKINLALVLLFSILNINLVLVLLILILVWIIYGLENYYKI